MWPEAVWNMRDETGLPLPPTHVTARAGSGAFITPKNTKDSISIWMAGFPPQSSGNSVPLQGGWGWVGLGWGHLFAQLGVGCQVLICFYHQMTGNVRRYPQTHEKLYSHALCLITLGLVWIFDWTINTKKQCVLMFTKKKEKHWRHYRATAAHSQLRSWITFTCSLTLET